MCDRVNECEFVKELREQIKALKIELEKLKKQVKNPSNSSLPSSSDRNKKYYPPREKSGKKQGGQKGHNGSAKTLYDNPDEIIEFYPQKCSHFDNDQFIEKEAVLEQRQVIDIPPIQPYITEYQQKARICNKCGKRNVGTFPENIAPNVQIGGNSKAIIGYLNIQHHMGYERLLQVFNDIFNFDISKGTVDNKIKGLAKELTPIYDNILESLKNSDVIGSDRD